LRHRAYPHLRASTTGEERRSRLICRFSSIKGTRPAASVRGPAEGRAPGIYTHESWLWIPGSSVRSAPE
jgi:hypothetical protein